MSGMMTEKPQVQKIKIAAQVRERLLQSLAPLAPGTPLPSERRLMEEFGVGRPAIREALQSLEGAGLIEIRHGGRARIAEPSMGRTLAQIGDTMKHLLIHSPASLENLKDLRLMLESEMARLAARRRTPSDVARLRGAHAAQAAAQGDGREFLRLDGCLHREIAAISGNPLYAVLIEAIFQWLSDFHAGDVSVPGLEALTLREHTDLIDAIEAGDASQAVKVMHAHLTRANDLYRKSNLLPEA